jgi:hypothetical protein
VNVQSEENKPEKKKFWQRFRPEKKEKTPVEVVTISNLVKKFLGLLCCYN